MDKDKKKIDNVPEIFLDGDEDISFSEVDYPIRNGTEIAIGYEDLRKKDFDENLNTGCSERYHYL